MNKSQSKNIKLAKKQGFIEFAKPISIHAFYLLASFAFSCTSVFKELSPLGVAFTASTTFYNLPASLLGSIMGYLIFNETMVAIRYIAALLIVTISIFAMKKVFNKNLPPLYSALFSFTAIFTTGMAILLTGSINLKNSALYISEALIAGGVSYFFASTYKNLKAKKSLKYIPKPMLTSVLISFGFFLLSMEWIKFGNISLARIVASFVILLSATYSKEAGGAIAGITSGISLSFADKMLHLIGGYATGGLLAGFFGQYGRLASVLAFIGANAVSAFTAQDIDQGIATIIEAAIASAVFILLPSKVRQRAEDFFAANLDEVSGEGYKNILRFRLCTAANAIGEVSHSVSTASRIIKKLEKREESGIFEAVKNDVCSSCIRKSSCWEYNYDASTGAFESIAETLRLGQRIEKDKIANNFANNCKKINLLLESFEKIFIEHIAKAQYNNKISDMQAVASDQFTALSSMLANLTENFSKDLIFYPETAESAKIALESVGVNVKEVYCSSDEGGNIHLQAICGPKRKRVTNKAVVSALYDATGIDFDSPLVIETDTANTVLMISEKTHFKVTSGSSQYISEGEQHCGDAFDYFLDGYGHYVLVLCDGMGTGPRAAVDGSMTCSLSSRLIKSGFDFDSTLKTVNSALMIKSKEETLSTLDLLSVNLYNGDATFLKAGAAASFIYRKGKAMKIECASLPLGILKEVSFQRIAGKLQDGDIVISLSDGAIGLTKEAITEVLFDNHERSPGILAGLLAKKARKLSPKKLDDITVIVSVFKTHLEEETSNTSQEKETVKI